MFFSFFIMKSKSLSPTHTQRMSVKKWHEHEEPEVTESNLGLRHHIGYHLCLLLYDVKIHVTIYVCRNQNLYFPSCKSFILISSHCFIYLFTE